MGRSTQPARLPPDTFIDPAVDHRYLTLGEAAAYLRCSKSTIARAIAAGTLPDRRIHERGVHMFLRTDLDLVMYDRNNNNTTH